MDKPIELVHIVYITKHKPGDTMITVKVTCHNGNSWVTQINGNLETAKAYFMGQCFVREDDQGNERKDIVALVEEQS